MSYLRRFPALVILILIGAALMLIPAVHAAQTGLWQVARVFFYHAAFFIALGCILGLATMNRVPRQPARYHLMTLLLAYVLLPVVLGAPLAVLLPGLGIGGAYFEMLSCLTTTGATLFDRPRLLPDTLHLWRALIGWSGGLMILVTAVAILAPLNLGGFEIGQDGIGLRGGRSGGTIDEASKRILRQAGQIAPVYAGFTGFLALCLIFAGARPFVALCHAMAVLSTSGISPVGGLEGGQSGRLGEMAILPFFLLAVSHRAMSFDLRRGHRLALTDPQIQLMLISVLSVTLLLFLRSFIGAAEIDRQDSPFRALQAIWGSLFTVLSFLTTTGFESPDWRAMQLWSHLPDPGTILLGVAVMGGGIATTAGGVKLLRLYALYRHGLRELDLLVHPSSVARHGQGDRVVSENGPRIAFVFLMLFLVSLGILMIAFSLTGLEFDQSLALGIASLTTTGPAIRTLGGGASYGDLDSWARVLFATGMIVGRMETIVIIALFNPAYWRH
ncbi:MAG: TrkH family potassium uptake protein [Rhodobacteraceae bacterium]|uniref:TrkH family potassium uptake protein n=1 Tax=Amaricoccus sp. TaxID=1872485 RepID=UPI001DB3FE65|nr:potassium transporter TrkG [Amaricoccus sp.]MCB1375558.1 TrkH family potassium uptake protein [Paracoccaceae bacterium]HRW14620.1 potassium transporter TrkG [Amaricoccus sp.]